MAMIRLCKDRRCGYPCSWLTLLVLFAFDGRFFTPCFKIYANFAFLIKFLRIFSLNLVLSLSAEVGWCKNKALRKQTEKRLERAK